MKDERIEELLHDIRIEAHIPEDGESHATIETFIRPDGTSGATLLRPKALREIADTLNELADRMENNE